MGDRIDFTSLPRSPASPWGDPRASEEVGSGDVVWRAGGRVGEGEARGDCEKKGGWLKPLFEFTM